MLAAEDESIQVWTGAHCLYGIGMVVSSCCWWGSLEILSQFQAAGATTQM